MYPSYFDKQIQADRITQLELYIRHDKAIFNSFPTDAKRDIQSLLVIERVIFRKSFGQIALDKVDVDVEQALRERKMSDHIELHAGVDPVSGIITVHMNSKTFNLICDLVKNQERIARSGDGTFRGRGVTDLHHRLLQGAHDIKKSSK